MLNETLTIGCISWQFREYLFGLKIRQLDPQRQSCRYDNVPKHKQASVIHTPTQKKKQASKSLFIGILCKPFICMHSHTNPHISFT